MWEITKPKDIVIIIEKLDIIYFDELPIDCPTDFIFVEAIEKLEKMFYADSACTKLFPYNKNKIIKANKILKKLEDVYLIYKLSK